VRRRVIWIVITVNVYDFRPTVALPKDAEDKRFW
jgi:hypothetical protein